MKRQRKRALAKQAAARPAELAAQATAARQAASRTQARRRFLRLARNAAIGLPVLGAVGYFSVDAVQATIHEADLSRIGQGVPAIVQIHDPTCMMCQALQSQTRSALRDFDEANFVYLVANIRQPEGRALAAQYGVPHVTLLFFDPAGEMVQVVRGPLEDAQLRPLLAAHLDAGA